MVIAFTTILRRSITALCLFAGSRLMSGSEKTNQQELYACSLQPRPQPIPSHTSQASTPASRATGKESSTRRRHLKHSDSVVILSTRIKEIVLGKLRIGYARETRVRLMDRGQNGLCCLCGATSFSVVLYCPCFLLQRR